MKSNIAKREVEITNEIAKCGFGRLFSREDSKTNLLVTSDVIWMI